MNYIDIILGIFLLWGAVKGIKNGLIVEIASLTALFLGIYGALKFSYFTSDLLVEKLHLTTRYLHLISFAITFVVIVILVHWLAKALDKLVKAIALGFINRFLGLLFGLVKVAFILSILLVFLNVLDKKAHFLPEEKVKESILYDPVSRFAPSVFSALHFDITAPLVGKPAGTPPVTI